MEAAGISGEPPELAYFTQDTYVNPHTNLCARLAAGSCVDVATAVFRWGHAAVSRDLTFLCDFGISWASLHLLSTCILPCSDLPVINVQYPVSQLHNSQSEGCLSTSEISGLFCQIFRQCVTLKTGVLQGRGDQWSGHCAAARSSC